jgi:hypothetical protein
MTQPTLLELAKQLLVCGFGVTHILHQHQKPGFLQLLQPESLDFSLINPVFQVLLRKVQDVR